MANKDNKRNYYTLLGVLTMTLTDKEIEAILNTLEHIEVHGFENMDKLMALIQFFKIKPKESEEKDG